jgi:outer membrane protein
MRRKKSSYLLLTSILASTSFLSYADSNPKTNFKIGLGASSYLSEYEKSSGDENSTLDLFIEFESGRFHIDRKTIYYNFIENNSIEIALLGESNGVGFDDDDRKIFKGMEERDYSFDAGLRIATNVLDGKIVGSITSDIADSHDGEIYKLFYEKVFHKNRWKFKPEIGLTHYSDDFVDYYYGVNKDEATSTRSFYKGSSTTIAHAGLEIRYQITPKLQFHSDLRLRSISDEIRESPLTKDESLNSNIFFGLTYQF